MAKVKVYRTYRFIDKDPVIDKLRTVVQDEGLIKKLGIVARLSGVSHGAIDGWFNGATKKPQHWTMAAVITSLGYEFDIVRTSNEKLDVDAELVKAKKWLKEHPPIKRKSVAKKKKK